MKFQNLDSEEGLTELSQHLADNTYVGGNIISKDDFELQFHLKGQFFKYQPIARWHRNLMSFSLAEMVLLGVTFPSCGAGKEGPCGGKPCGGKPCEKAKEETKQEIDLFGDDDEEDPEAEKARIEAVAAKKAAKEASKDAEKKAKPREAAKSSLVIDVMPSGTDVDLDDLAKNIRNISIEGVTWSQKVSKEPVAFGLMCLRLGATIVDELVQTDSILEQIDCIGMTPENAAERKRLMDAGEDWEGDEGTYVVASSKIVSFNKL